MVSAVKPLENYAAETISISLATGIELYKTTILFVLAHCRIIHNGNQTSLPISSLCLKAWMRTGSKCYISWVLGLPYCAAHAYEYMCIRAATQRLYSISGQSQPNKAHSLTLPHTSMGQGGTSKPYAWQGTYTIHRCQSHHGLMSWNNKFKKVRHNNKYQSNLGNKRKSQSNPSHAANKWWGFPCYVLSHLLLNRSPHCYFNPSKKLSTLVILPATYLQWGLLPHTHIETPLYYHLEGIYEIIIHKIPSGAHRVFQIAPSRQLLAPWDKWQ